VTVHIVQLCVHCRGKSVARKINRNAPKTAEYLIRNLHKPLDLEMLKRACENRAFE